MADRYFVGDTDSSWNDADNWATSSGGSGGAGVPGVADDVYLDGNSPDCDIDVNAVCDTIDSTGYANTLTQTGSFTLTVTNDITWVAGTFAGGSGAIQCRELTLSGGTFTSTSGTMTATGGKRYDFSAGGTFNHNNGNLTYTGNASVASPMDFGGNDLYDWTPNQTNSNSDYKIATAFTVKNNCYYLGGRPSSDSGDMSLEGDLIYTNGMTTIRNWKIIFTGSNDQEVYKDKAGGTVRLNQVEINKSGGTLYLFDILELEVSTGVTCWEYVAGTVDAGTSTIRYRGHSNDWDDGTTEFYNFNIDKNNFATNMTLLSDIKVTNDLTLTGVNQIIGAYTIYVGGDLILNDPGINGSASIDLNGSGNQEISGTGGSVPNGNMVISNTGGIVTMVADMDVDASGQTLTVNTGAVLFVSAGTLTVNGGITNNGHLRKATAGTISGSVSGHAVQDGEACPGTMTYTIGSGKDFAQVTNFNDALSDEEYFVDGDDAVGEVYGALTFQNVTWNPSIALTSILITVPVAERHTGIAGTGARVTAGGNNQSWILGMGSTKWTVEWLDFDGDDYGCNFINVSGSVQYGNVPIVRYCIFHDCIANTDNYRGFIFANSRDTKVHNCILYNNSRNSTSANVNAITVDGDQADGGVYNNTIYNISNPNAGGSGGASGIIVNTNGSNAKVYNNVVFNISSGRGASYAKCFNFAGASVDHDYNMDDDGTATGSNSLNNKSASDQFVSIASGTEDFHLKDGADAIHAGDDLGTTDGVNVDIDQQDRTANSRTWDMGADQKPERIVKTIGSGKDYTTLVAWEADLDDDTIYIEGDTAVGTIDENSQFVESVTIDGGETVGLAGIELTVSDLYKHDGLAGTGAGINYSGGSNFHAINISTLVPTVIEWLEITKTGGASNRKGVAVSHSDISITHIIRNCIIHSLGNTQSGCDAISPGGSFGNKFRAQNNIIYDCYVGIGATSGSGALHAIMENNTVYGCNTGIKGGSNTTVRNNIAMDSSGNDYSGSFATSEYNMSSDATASGTGSLTNKVASNQFDDIGNDDFLLKIGSDAYQTGTDLGTTDEINIDIIKQDRDAIGETWCMGAHQLVVAITITSIVPNTGSVIGGETIQINGTGIQIGAVAYIDNILCDTISVHNPTHIVCKTPANTAGAKDVKVVNLDTSEAIEVGGYTYEAQPAPVPTKEYNMNRSQSSSITGADLVGKGGAQEVGTYAWFDTLEAKDFVLDFELNGSLVDDVEIAVQACLIGGESNPKVIGSLNPTATGFTIVEALKAYDRIRAVVTKLSTAGKGSQVVLSGRN